MGVNLIKLLFTWGSEVLARQQGGSLSGFQSHTLNSVPIGVVNVITYELVQVTNQVRLLKCVSVIWTSPGQKTSVARLDRQR